jgi:protein gp37
MGKFSGISWTHHTFNPWIGCTKVSEGCRYCYAEQWDKRFSDMKDDDGNSIAGHWGPGAPRRVTSQHNWNDPIRWNREAVKNNTHFRVFCASLADVFDKEAPDGQRERLWPLVKQTTNLYWLILTKRPELINSMLPSDWGDGYPNVWLGTSTEDQKTADLRIGHLANVKAKIRFLSVEPQIENIDFTQWLTPKGENWVRPFDWMIFGGESGSEARKFDPDWIREPLLQAKKVDVKVFVKQMGSVWAAENGTEDKKGGDPKEWPPLFRCQEFPEALPANV